MMTSFKAIFKEDSEMNQEIKKQIKQRYEQSEKEQSCMSCRYKHRVDDGQGYSHIVCRLDKKKSGILEEDKRCIFHRTKEDFNIKDYDRKAIIEIFLEWLNQEIDSLNEETRLSSNHGIMLKNTIEVSQTEKIRDHLIWLMGGKEESKTLNEMREEKGLERVEENKGIKSKPIFLKYDNKMIPRCPRCHHALLLRQDERECSECGKEIDWS